MPGNFKEIYIGRGLIEDGGSVSLKKKKQTVMFNIFNIFLLCLLRYWLLFKAMIIGFYFVSDKYYKESRNKRINSNT